MGSNKYVRVVSVCIDNSFNASVSLVSVFRLFRFSLCLSLSCCFGDGSSGWNKHGRLVCIHLCVGCLQFLASYLPFRTQFGIEWNVFHWIMMYSHLLIGRRLRMKRKMDKCARLDWRRRWWRCDSNLNEMESERKSNETKYHFSLSKWDLY